MNLPCPHCQRTIAVSDNQAGRPVACPHCKHVFTPPAASAVHPDAQPVGDSTVAGTEAHVDEPVVRKHIAIQLPPARLRWLAAGLCFINSLLLFFPWQRVLNPTSLVGNNPPRAIKDLVLIVGCPASMNERTPADDLKIEAVKQAAGDFVDKLPEAVRLGLVVFGRDRVDVCGVEVARKLAPLDAAGRGEVKKIISRLNPVGLAPLAEALKAAREALVEATAGGVVLFADGLDTCNGDTAAAAAALAKLPTFTYGLHIIGFGVIPKELRLLRAAAETGKGSFVDTQSKSELTQAMSTLLRQTSGAAEQEYVVNELGRQRHTGISNAFGTPPASAALLTLVYVILVLTALIGSVAYLVVQFTKEMLVERVSPWLIRGTAAASALGLFVLLVQMLVGFPVENSFQQFIFTQRTGWLTLLVMVHCLSLAALLGLLTLRGRTDGPELRIDW